MLAETKNPTQILWTSGKLEIAVEPLALASYNCESLLKQHWLEIANYKDKFPLEPRWDAIFQLEREGRIVLLTLRREGKLIGYSMFVLNKHLHYASMMVATNDILFVAPTERDFRLGYMLIIQSEKYLKSLKVDKVTWHMKPHKSFAKLLEKIGGYTHEEEIYGKLLGVD